jgi:hypothetical protein
VELQWATYYDAADHAGLSRLWGGIHVSVDDLTGRRTGSQCGKGVWALARQFFDGSVVQSPFAVTVEARSATRRDLRCESVRGFYYKLQTTSDLSLPFVDDPGGFMRCLDSPLIHTDITSEPKKFYRFVKSPTP